MGSRDSSDPRDQFYSFPVDLRQQTLQVNNRNTLKFHSSCSSESLTLTAWRTMWKRILRSHPGSAISSDACFRQGYEKSWDIIILHIYRYLPRKLSYPKCSQEPGREQKEHV